VYDGERADLRALEQLETVLRDVGEELALWRARALKAESDTQRGGGGGRTGAGESSRRGSELEVENRHLRQRVEAAKTRVQELLSRLTFLEEQAKEAAK
jgi:hypothetical protein